MAARLAHEANIGSEPNDRPLVAAARVRLAQLNQVAEAELNRSRHRAMSLPSVWSPTVEQLQQSLLPRTRR